MTHQRTTSPHLQWSVPLVTLLIVVCSGLGGCSDQHATYQVDTAEARDTLQQVLQSWQEGKPIDWWRSQQPEVVVQDFDWLSGVKLQSFEVLPQEKAVDANLHCTVRLQLVEPGKSVARQREVTYLVGTQPIRTVFRQVMP